MGAEAPASAPYYPFPKQSLGSISVPKFNLGTRKKESCQLSAVSFQLFSGSQAVRGNPFGAKLCFARPEIAIPVPKFNLGTIKKSAIRFQL
ncbi:MAG: hypothetical protein HY743_09680 [Deltaproteobacteria bacterium]|nr:hypothetical protein [Deltaproteobacteria bacterium]